MKLAIIGDSPYAVEAALHFQKLDVNITWFCSQEINWSRSDFKLADGSSLKQYYEESFISSKEKLSEQIKIRHCEVLRVTKRFLLTNEQLKNRTRLADLFRVVYLVDPKEVIESQKNSNPEVYAKLSEQMKDSLSQQLESFEDFDLIIDAQTWKPNYMGVSAPAVREQVLSEDARFFYGLECFDKSPSSKEMALIGSGQMAASFLVENSKWLENSSNRVFVISTQEKPFGENSSSQLSDLLKLEDEKLKKVVEEFIVKLKEWDELEDYMKAKIPRPEEPIPQVVYFSAHNVTCVDGLVDQKKFYLTCEIPSFREAGVQIENAGLSLKTIGVEQAYTLTGNSPCLDKYKSLRVSSYDSSLVSTEEGLYFLGKINKDDSYWEIENFPEQLKSIQNDVEKYFSRT